MVPTSLLTIALRRKLFAIGLVAAAGLMASGCMEETLQSRRSMDPLSQKALAQLADKQMTKEQPILVRIYKQESELEVWKKRGDGKYALFKTYPICRWSGELGPKVREGDRQAPEGFYQITRGHMNPNSSYYLSFNIGFPNAFDAAYGRSGSHLMVHGDCSSRGCYAMTDEQISEVYALAREAFSAGQSAFQVQALPFRMTAENFAKHRANPNIAFWKNLREGVEHFDVSHVEPKVDVCEKRYVFNATPKDGKFTASGKCPAYDVPQDIAEAVSAKQREDDTRIASLVAAGTPTLPAKTGRDGGMHPVFMAALNPGISRDANGDVVRASKAYTPGTIPSTVRPPADPEPVVASLSADGNVPSPRRAPLAKVGTVPAALVAETENSGPFGNLFSNAPPQTASTPAQPQQQVVTSRVVATAAQPAPAAAPASSEQKPGFFARMMPGSLFGSKQEAGATEKKSSGGFSLGSLFSKKDETASEEQPRVADVPMPTPRPASPAAKPAAPATVGAAARQP